MLAVLVRRLLFMVPAGVLVVTFMFAMFHMVPGDPAILIAGDRASPEAVESIRKAYGLDRPLHIQYKNYIFKVIQGDLGISIYSKDPVIELVIPRFINTAILAVLAMVFAIPFSLMLGCASAVWRNSNLDKIVTGLSLVGICTPLFLSGLLLMYCFSVRFRFLPVGGMATWQAYVMPVLSLGLFQTAFLTRMIRANMVDALEQDYIETARSKGVHELKVVLKHALRNGLLPVITVTGLQFGYTLGGAVVTETIFTWPGLGRLMVDSILKRDLPVTQGSILIFAAAFILVNLAVDLSYSIVDPRIQYD